MTSPAALAVRVSGSSRFGGTVTLRPSLCAPGATVSEKRRAVHRQAPFSRTCQPSTSWVTGGGVKARERRRQKTRSSLLVAGDEPVADFPAAAIEQGAQAGFGEDPVVGLVAAETVAPGEEGDRLVGYAKLVMAVLRRQ